MSQRKKPKILGACVHSADALLLSRHAINTSLCRRDCTVASYHWLVCELLMDGRRKEGHGEAKDLQTFHLPIKY